MSSERTPVAHHRFGSSAGQPITRRDGPLKVTGRATFAADNLPDGLLYAVAAVSTIARGRVKALDVAAAKAHEGVVEVYTSANSPRLAVDPDHKFHPYAFRFEALKDDSVRYPGQPIALVLAETLEAATEGVVLLNPRYESEPARTSLDNGERFSPASAGMGGPSRVAVGDIAAGFAAAVNVTEGAYETPAQYHNAMEPHAVVACWDGDKVILDIPNQAIVMSCAIYGAYLGIPPQNVLIRSPYIGGGFGSKGFANGSQILAMLAARELGRPVKLVYTRAQMYGSVGHRASTWQSLRLGTDAEGRLTALHHRSLCATSSLTSSSLRRTQPCRFIRVRRYLPSMTACDSTLARRGQCVLRVKPQARRRSRSPSTKPQKLAAWIRSPSGFSIMPKPSPAPAVRSRPRRCANATSRARRVSDGLTVHWPRARCVTARACASAGAWAPRSFPVRISRPKRAPRYAPTELLW
jgi:CO/xanthine dehydrogenase Mo-binding subunit